MTVDEGCEAIICICENRLVPDQVRELVEAVREQPDSFVVVIGEAFGFTLKYVYELINFAVEACLPGNKK